MKYFHFFRAIFKKIEHEKNAHVEKLKFLIKFVVEYFTFRNGEIFRAGSKIDPDPTGSWNRVCINEVSAWQPLEPRATGMKRVERNEEEKEESRGLDKSAREKEMPVAMG